MRHLLLFSIILLLFVVPLAHAIEVGSFVANAVSCTPLTVELSFLAVRTAPLASVDNGAITVYDGDGTQVANQPFVIASGTSSALIYQLVQWTAQPQANPLRVVVSDSASGTITWEQSFTTDCLTRTVDNPITTYSSSGIQISITPETVTFFGTALDGESGIAVVSLTADDLAALPETPDENTLIAVGTETTYWGDVNVYQLTTGEIQVNVGPDAEGKVRVTIYDAIPPTRVYGYEFNVLEQP